MMLTLIGYFPKKVVVYPSHGGRGAKFVRSACECISEGPPGWMERRVHNNFYLYSTISGAMDVLPVAAVGDYELHAYRLLDMAWDEGRGRSFLIPSVEVEALPREFVSIGFDVVSDILPHRVSGHSPLSCNSMEKNVATNGHWLLDDLETAKAVAERFSRGRDVEPGEYYVVEVWMRQMGIGLDVDAGG